MTFKDLSVTFPRAYLCLTLCLSFTTSHNILASFSKLNAKEEFSHEKEARNEQNSAVVPIRILPNT